MIDYNIEPEKRWATLHAEIMKKPRFEIEALLLSAVKYRSGANDIGSVYMGSLQTASVLRALGDSYPASKPWSEIVTQCSEVQLTNGVWEAMHTIEYMMEHPREKCPTCGGLVNPDGKAA